IESPMRRVVAKQAIPHHAVPLSVASIVTPVAPKLAQLKGEDMNILPVGRAQHFLDARRESVLESMIGIGAEKPCCPMPPAGMNQGHLVGALVPGLAGRVAEHLDGLRMSAQDRGGSIGGPVVESYDAVH